MSGTFTDADGNEDGNGENEGDEGDEQEPAAELSIEKQWVADLSEEQDGSTRKCFDLATEGKILIILIKQLQAVNGSDGVAARGLVNGRDPYRRYGRDLQDRTFTACQFKRITARHLRMKQFIGIAGGFISGPVFFSGPGKRSQINSNAARHLRMKQFIGIAGGFISGPVFFWSWEAFPNQFKRCPSSADETVYRNCGRIYFRTCFFLVRKKSSRNDIKQGNYFPAR